MVATKPMLNLFKKQATHFVNKEDLILRDYLALERTKLANESTLLSYIRTSLYMLITGIALLQLKDLRQLHWMGFFALGVSVISLVVGIMRYRQLRRKLKNYYYANPGNLIE